MYPLLLIWSLNCRSNGTSYHRLLLFSFRSSLLQRAAFEPGSLKHVTSSLPSICMTPSVALPSLVGNRCAELFSIFWLKRMLNFFQSLRSFPISKRFSERALSYPLEDVDSRRLKSWSFRNQIFRLKISESGKNSAASATTMLDFKRDMKSTFKTLAMLFLYLLMWAYFFKSSCW